MILLFKSHVKAHSRKDGAWVRDHFRQAAKYAAELHQGQFRKDGKTPYIKHPITVANILHREGQVSDPVVLIAALLHDTIEDIGVTHADLARMFGREVADVVREVTNDESLPKAQQKQAQIDHGPKRSERANILKIADKIANLRDIIAAPPLWPADRKMEYFDHARRVVEAMPNPHPVLAELFGHEYRNREKI